MDYKKVNKQSWNNRVASHFESAFYDVPNFIAGATSLNPPELALFGDVRGKKILHLQCHFGQDSISLARMGAHVTGMDLSDAAIAKARELNETCGTDVTFVVSDVYELPEHLEGQFDLVFTSYGTIGWLPDLKKWAGVIDHFLKPGGSFVFAEFHPAMWMFDDDFNTVFYSYFTDEPIIESNSGTYADRGAAIQIDTISWNHGLSEVISNLLAFGMQLNHFEELDTSPYNCVKGMIEVAPKQFRIEKFGAKLPLMYTLKMEKPL